MHITKKDLLWSYIGYILRFFSGIIVLPILVRYLSSDELGIWYVFLSLGGLVQLLDMGFAGSISRNVSYAYSGARHICAEGLPPIYGTGPNYKLIVQLLVASRHIFIRISLLALALLLLVGVPYILWLSRGFAEPLVAVASWFVYTIALVLNFYYSYWADVLSGIGCIKEGQRSMIISRAIYIILLIIGVQFMNGLIAVSMAFCVSGVVLRWLYSFEFKRAVSLPQIHVTIEDSRRITRLMWHNAKKGGLVMVGAFLVGQAGTLLTSYWFDLGTVASFGLTNQLASMLSSLAMLPATTYMPKFNELQLLRQPDRVATLLGKILMFFSLLYLIGGSIVVFCGNPIMVMLHSNTKLLPTAQTLLILLYTFLDAHHSIFSIIITTKNKVPYVSASLVAGGMMLLFAFVNVGILELGFWGLLWARFLSNAVYQNWYWPYYVLHDMHISLVSVWSKGARDVKSIIKRY